VVEGNRAKGVTLADGRRLAADLVVANADLPYVYDKLLPDDGSAARLAGKKYTSSALMFYWAVRGARSPALLHHNAFLADHQFRRSFEQIFDQHTLPEEPSFYVCAPMRTDPRFAPPDGDSLMVLVPVGHLDAQHPQDWQALRARARASVTQRLAALGVDDLDGRVVAEATLGPAEYERDLNLARGSLSG
jgi:phytoene dehydrogenase-like protein